MSEDGEEFTNPMEHALAKAIDRVFVKADQTPFDQLVASFRALEADFVPRFRLMGDELLALEARRRIAEIILRSAIDKAIDEELPFEVCRPLWSDVVELGFTDLGRACTMSWYYAKLGCLQHNEIEEGICVLKPVLNELTRTLSDLTLPETARSYYGEELQRLQTVLDELRSQRQ